MTLPRNPGAAPRDPGVSLLAPSICQCLCLDLHSAGYFSDLSGPPGCWPGSPSLPPPAHPPQVASLLNDPDLPSKNCRDFPGGPMAKTAVPMQGTRVGSLVKELDPVCHRRLKILCATAKTGCSQINVFFLNKNRTCSPPPGASVPQSCASFAFPQGPARGPTQLLLQCLLLSSHRCFCAQDVGSLTSLPDPKTTLLSWWCSSDTLVCTESRDPFTKAPVLSPVPSIPGPFSSICSSYHLLARSFVS